MLATGIFLFIMIILMISLSSLLSTHDPLQINLERRFNKPDFEYLLGTDQLGRCIFSRVLHGTRLSLLAGISVATCSLLIALPFGIISGIGSTKTDRFIMLICDIFLSFPFIILAIAICSILEPSLKAAMFGFAAYSWAWWTKFIRGMVLSAREKNFVKATIAMGVGDFYIIRRCILPQLIAPVIVSFSLYTGRILIVISSLSFLGLGVQPPVPELGNMLREARLYMTTYPHLLFAPAISIIILAIAFNLIGEGLRDFFHIKESYESP